MIIQYNDANIFSIQIAIVVQEKFISFYLRHFLDDSTSARNLTLLPSLFHVNFSLVLLDGRERRVKEVDFLVQTLE